MIALKINSTNIKKKFQFKWRMVKGAQGVMVAASKEIEDLLPWWWLNYSSYNSFPVIFVDFGMSLKANKWCREKGYLISLKELSKCYLCSEEKIDPELLSKWKVTNINDFQERHFWFKKPLAMLNTFFQKTLWMDLDCEVRGPLDSLFAIKLNDKNEIGMVAEPEIVQKDRVFRGMQTENEVLYNSGLVLFSHGSLTIQRWIKSSLDSARGFLGDQELISHLIYKYKLRVLKIPETYNWVRLQGENSEALVLHYTGPLGKILIREKIKKLSNVAFMIPLVNI